MATNDPSQKHGWVWSPSRLVLHLGRQVRREV